MNTSIFTMLLRYNIQLESFWSFFYMWNILYKSPHLNNIGMYVSKTYIENNIHTSIWFSISYIRKIPSRKFSTQILLCINLFCTNKMSSAYSRTIICLMYAYRKVTLKYVSVFYFVNIWEIFAGFS